MNEQTISQNIRAIREKRKLTLTEVAQKVNITKSSLSKIENGHISTPISTLIRIAEALGVPMSHFFTETAGNPPYVLTRKGEGEVYAKEGLQFGYSYQTLASGMRNHKMDPFLLTIPPEAKHDDCFQHEGEEFISGKIEFTIGDEVLYLNPGDTLLFDSSIEHVGKSMNNEFATLLCIFLSDK
jgi:transcriptional regulator with XRE-family HTH domain